MIKYMRPEWRKFLIVAACCFTFAAMPNAVNARTFKRVPVPVRVQHLQLYQPFTISYVAATEFYNNGTMVHGNARLTLSYDGLHLLYRSEDLDTHVITTMLYDGYDTYEMENNSFVAEIEPGFDFSRLLFCPLPGVGIPNMPFLTDGLLASYFATIMKNRIAPHQGSEKQYIDKGLFDTAGQMRDYGVFDFTKPMPGLRPSRDGFACVVSAPTAVEPNVLWYETFDNVPPNLGSIWEFFGYRGFEGIWLATRIRMRWYATLSSDNHNVLVQSATYALASAVNQSLQPSAFDPETYLPAHANIGDETESPERSFLYQKGKGSLQLQRKNGVEISEALALSRKSPMNAGMIGLALILATSAAWFWWRRGREGRLRR